MMKKLIILIGFLLVLAGFVSAEDIFDCQIIDESGDYTLRRDINTDESRCIEIQTSDVFLNCGGHSIHSNSERLAGILARDPNYNMLANIRIQGCSISGWNNGIKFDEVEDSTISHSSFF